MENNEMMNFEEIEITDCGVTEKSGISTGVAMLIGAGLTFAIGAGVKLGKKLYDNYKAKKAFEQASSDHVDYQDLA